MQRKLHIEKYAWKRTELSDRQEFNEVVIMNDSSMNMLSIYLRILFLLYMRRTIRFIIRAIQFIGNFIRQWPNNMEITISFRWICTLYNLAYTCRMINRARCSNTLSFCKKKKLIDCLSFVKWSFDAMINNERECTNLTCLINLLRSRDKTTIKFSFYFSGLINFVLAIGVFE